MKLDHCHRASCVQIIEALRARLWNYEHGTAGMCADAAIGAAEQWQARVKELENKRTALHVKISMLNEEISALNFALEGSVKQTELLEAKIKFYESALLLAFPNGAGDGVFELWNEARKLK